MLWSFFIALSLLEEEGRLACKMCSSSPIIFKFRFREPHWTQNNCRIEDWIKKNWRSVVVRCKTVTYLVCAVFLFIGLFVLSRVCACVFIHRRRAEVMKVRTRIRTLSWSSVTFTTSTSCVRGMCDVTGANMSFWCLQMKMLVCYRCLRNI